MEKRIFCIVTALALLFSVTCYAYSIDEYNGLHADINGDGVEETIETYFLPYTAEGSLPLMMCVDDSENRLVGEVRLFDYVENVVDKNALTLDLYLPETGVLALVTYQGVEMPVVRWMLFDIGDEGLENVMTVENPGYTLGVGLVTYDDLASDNCTALYQAAGYNADEYISALDSAFAGTGIEFIFDEAGNAVPSENCAMRVLSLTEKDFFADENDSEGTGAEESDMIYYIYAVKNVKIRESAGTDGKEVGLLENGKTASYLGESVNDSEGNTWYKIGYSDVEGWVSSEYALMLDDYANGENQGVDGDHGELVITSQSVNVRSQPDLDGEKIGVLKEKQTAEITGNVSIDDRGVAWFEILYGDGNGWVSSRYSKVK